MSMEYIRKTYGVPAKRGGRIKYNSAGGEKLGTITGASDSHINIRLDGDRISFPFHPTWKLEYLSDEDNRHQPQGGEHE